MSKTGPLILTMVLCACASGCGDGATSPAGISYAGEWSGTTSQGKPIAFTVSSDQKVTAVTVEYSFNGCSGSKVLSNLNITIGDPRAPLADYTSGPPGGPDATAIHFLFTSPSTANGAVAFIGYTDCGNAGGTWVATKR